MEDVIKRAERAAFVRSNGTIMRTLNVMDKAYKSLEVVRSVVADDGVSEYDFVKSVNFLAGEGYIRIRDISAHKIVEFSDATYKECEATLTPLGTRVLMGLKTDPAIEV